MYKEIKGKFKKLEKKLVDPKIINDPKKLAEISRQHAELKEIFELVLDLERTEGQIKENHTIIETENDQELIALAKEELEQLTAKAKKLKQKIENELHPSDPLDKKNIIMEIRAGTGGDESALFVADLFRMYSRFAERQGWKTEILNSSRIGIGGFKEIIFSINGNDVYRYLKHEKGTHRVQRIPETEKQGRIHTSAVTVAIMPEAKKQDIEVKPEDLRIDTYAASGPGGQKVNTTNSAVRILHLPTNITVQCQDQKSQHQNKEKALQILRSRLFQANEEKRMQDEAAERKQQVGTGDRSEKIRTYNFPQDRITDHRIKKSWSNLNFILDGNLDSIIQALQENLKRN